jgi:hypothetical protein
MIWGYVFGKTSARFLRKEPNLALLILAGALPDFDLFTRQPYGTLLGHHGISHSWLVVILAFLPFFLAFKWRTIPYFISVLQHPLFGDLLANHVPLLFPHTLSEAGLNLSEINPPLEVGLEILGFTIFLAILIATGDWKKKLGDSKWSKLFMLLWVPPLFLTIAQGFLYYEPELLTQIYSGYAILSSAFLLALGFALAFGLRPDQKLIRRTNTS